MGVWKHDDCVCVSVGLTCVVGRGMWSCANASVDAYAVGVWVWMCLRVVGLHVCAWFGVWFCVVCVSLSRISLWLGEGGGAAMAGAVRHLTSLTTLEYVWGGMA